MAFESVKRGISSRTVDMLDGFPISPVHSILTVLMNDLQEFAGTTILVLDDYQFISNTDIHESMAFFLDHLPSNVHLVIATRSDPPIPLARLRARGQLTEIRADDLRFSYKETNDLLNQVMQLDLSTDDMNRLDERTEGWIAGLQMAALALKSISQSMQQDKSLFVKNFSGSNRYILDYLVEEVLSHQPRYIQDFLLQTSILENLSGPLCDAVTGRGSVISGEETSSSQNVLEYLERTNLFLVPLDSDRLWFRYHHLFADLLHARLEKQGSQKVSELHRRASEWYAQNLRLPESINHAIDAGEYDRACQLIDGIVEQMLAHNGTGLLRGWIGRLSPEVIITRPWL
jgi:LuxR family maltose regulon positive regulatory protein